MAPPPEEEERRNWLDLPREVTASILARLIAEDILTSAQFVCKLWLEVAKDPLTWKRIDMFNIGDHGSDLDLEKMCRCAVDRSCGQAVDVNIEYFGNDDVLNYISQSSPQIKRLRLTSCYHVSDEGLIETVARLPLLEELELTLCSFTIETLEAVGRHCPRLKSFKLNSQEYKLSDIDSVEEDDFNEDVFAIGKYMPELRHLQLIGNSMTNKGLEAILDGCPKLESLDLRRCLNISLRGNLWNRCTEQVKHLRLPNDSTEDYPFKTNFNDDFQDDPGFFSSHDGSPNDGRLSSLLDFYAADEYYPGDGFDYLERDAFDTSSGGDSFDYDDFTVPDNYW